MPSAFFVAHAAEWDALFLIAEMTRAGRALEIPHWLDTLVLAMPISWRGTLQQYVGRLHRLHVNKKQVRVYDYADVQVAMLARMYKKRLSGYAALGYTVVDGLED